MRNVRPEVLVVVRVLLAAFAVPEVCVASLTQECHASCQRWRLGDGYCDAACNAPACSFDEGDCAEECAPGCESFTGTLLKENVALLNEKDALRAETRVLERDRNRLQDETFFLWADRDKLELENNRLQAANANVRHERDVYLPSPSPLPSLTLTLTPTLSLSLSLSLTLALGPPSPSP